MGRFIAQPVGVELDCPGTVPRLGATRPPGGQYTFYHVALRSQTGPGGGP